MAKEKTESKKLVVRSASKELMEFSEQITEYIGFNPITQIFEVGNRVNAVAQLLSHPEVVEILEKLEGTPSGFMTDLAIKGQKYDVKTRAQAIHDGLVQGAHMAGNEINIIRGRGMLVKNFYFRMLWELGSDNSPSKNCAYIMDNWYHDEDYQGIDNGVMTFICTVEGTWTVRASGELKPFRWQKKVCVKGGGQYDTIDKAVGQCQRRAWQAFYERYSGVRTDDGEMDFDAGAVEPTPSVALDEAIDAEYDDTEKVKVPEEVKKPEKAKEPDVKKKKSSLVEPAKRVKEPEPDIPTPEEPPQSPFNSKKGPMLDGDGDLF